MGLFGINSYDRPTTESILQLKQIHQLNRQEADDEEKRLHLTRQQANTAQHNGDFEGKDEYYQSDARGSFSLSGEALLDI